MNINQFVSYKRLSVFKAVIITLLLFTVVLNVEAQKTVSHDASELLKDLTTIIDTRISEQVKVVGVGDITPFAKQSTDLCMAIITCLVSEQKFRTVALMQDDWLVRPLNDYLTSSMPFSNKITDSLVRLSTANTTLRTTSFGKFAAWLKQYNLAHKKAMVKLKGVAPDETIPPAYFLVAYVWPIDQANGLILSRKWGANIYNYDMAYNDIEVWYQESSKKTSLVNKHKELFARCGEDIMHNNTIRNNDASIVGHSNAIKKKADFLVDLIGGKPGEKTVFYSNNEDVVKSGYLFLGDTIVSIGAYLRERLGDKYYACVTDFADTAVINLVDNEAGVLTPVVISGSEQAKDLFRKKATFFMKEDYTDIKDYRPRTIFPVIGMERNILPGNNIPLMDALFIIQNLASTDFLKRPSMVQQAVGH